MKRNSIDIFNDYCLEVRNNFTHTHTQFRRPYNKKIQNKQVLRLFISSILSPFFLFIFTCIPAPVCAGKIMRSDFGYKVGGIFPMPPFRLATSQKFIKIIENMLKRFMFISLFVLLALPLVAQEKRGSTYIFRFVPGKDMFFIPYLQNASQWKELCDTLNVYMQQIKDGEMYINVSSYAATSGTRPASRVAYMRNNRVKAELITRLGLKEKMFVTDRIIPIGYGANNLHDVVVVTFPANVSKVARVAGEEAAKRVRAYNREMIANSEAERQMAEQKRQEEEQKCLAAERAERERLVTEATTRSLSLSSPEAQGEAVPNSVSLDDSNTTSDAAEHTATSTFSLRANLLRWATLTPDLGVEWRIDRRWSVLLNGTWTSWSWSDKDRRYALWKVSPEVRYYMGKEKRGYLGAMYHIGEFNYKLGETGRQGDYQGGGITGGYMLPLNRALSLDFHAALGYTYADYDKYKVTDGIRVRQGSDSKNYWGVNQLGVTLVWKFNQ